MRVFLMVVAVLALVFYAVLIWGGSNAKAPTSPDEAQQQRNGSLWGRAISAIGDRFAPKLELSKKEFDVNTSIDVPRSSQSTRIAKFALTVGDAIAIRYLCPPSAAANCPSTLCLTRSGQAPFPGCNKDNSSKGEGSLLIHAEGGRLMFEALHGPPARAALQ